MHLHICICIYAYAPLIATETPPGNLTKKAVQKQCFAKISGSKNPISPSPRLIIPGRRDASAVGYEFSVAKFFKNKPRSWKLGPRHARARAHVGARRKVFFWVAFGSVKRTRNGFDCELRRIQTTKICRISPQTRIRQPYWHRSKKKHPKVEYTTFMGYIYIYI